MDRGGGDRGSVLALAVLALVALELLAHGVLLLALQERLAATAGLRVLQARAAAEAATTLPPGLAFPDTLGALPVDGRAAWGTGGAGPPASRGTAQRLSREAWLLEGEGRAPGVTWVSRAGRLLWVLDPVARAAERGEAVLVYGGDVAVEPGALEAPPFRASAAPVGCRRWAEPLDSLLPPPPAVPLARMGTGAGVALGRLDLDALVRTLPRLGAGVGTPGPVAEGATCLAGAWNWGDPSDPEGPCGETFVGAAVEGDLVVDGGTGQGLLVATGRLTLRGTVFHGLVLAGGEVRVVEGGGVWGQVRAGGGVAVGRGGRAAASPCAVARALHAAGARLRVPVPLASARPFPLW